ncbi:MAG: radical SAM/SPASM domain-containing protein [Desulfuromonadaceae bacterium]
MSNSSIFTDPVTGTRYGFYDRLRSEFPSQIIADITEVCNLACVHCPHSDFKKTEHYAGRHLDPELNSKMVDEVRRHGEGITQYIRYTSNGEPLLHPKGYDLIEEAVRYSGVFVTLTTNGTIMNEVRTQRLLDAGVHLIDISIDAFYPETYANVRVNGDLAVTQKNVLRLIRWVKESRSATKVVVSYVEQPANCQETDKFEQFWNDNGADNVVIRRLHSCSGAKEGLATEKRQMLDETKSRKPCLYPWERIVLTARGDLAFCPADWGHRAFIEKYASTTIYDVWCGSFYDSLRKAHLENDFAEHAFCEQCPDWSDTRWPDEGRSYANMIEDFTGKE